MWCKVKYFFLGHFCFFVFTLLLLLQVYSDAAVVRHFLKRLESFPGSSGQISSTLNTLAVNIDVLTFIAGSWPLSVVRLVSS